MKIINKRRGKQPLTEKAYEKIRTRIIKGEFLPGQNLLEKELSLKFKIGRTPIREALIRLESEGLIEIHPRRSIFVANITLHSVRTFFETYLLIEKYITKIVAERITKEEITNLWAINEQINKAFFEKDFYQMSIENIKLHEKIAEASQNQYLTNIAKFLYLNSQRLSYISYSSNNKEFEERSEILDQHNKIIKYIDEKDLKNLEAVVDEHIKTFQRRISNSLIFKEDYQDEIIKAPFAS